MTPEEKRLREVIENMAVRCDRLAPDMMTHPNRLVLKIAMERMAWELREALKPVKT